MTSDQLIAVVIPLVSGAIGGLGAYWLQEQKYKREYRLHDSAEVVAKALLSHPTWRLRSFKVIRHHLGGFGDNELRQILVRTGAIRFKSKSGHELWGLVERNADRMGKPQIDQDPVDLVEQELFAEASADA